MMKYFEEEYRKNFQNEQLPDDGFDVEGLWEDIENGLEQEQTPFSNWFKISLLSLLFIGNTMTRPHFLYNTFNTLYALSETKSELVSNAILKLSNIMRYLLNNASHSRVSIYEELNFIRDFIDFQKLRIINPEKKIIVNIEDPSSDFSISPTLLLSFVENTFKHFNLVAEKSKLKIDFQTVQNGFQYQVSNIISTGKKTQPGTGNENLKKLLEIEYTDNYEFRTWQENDTFNAFIHIKKL